MFQHLARRLLTFIPVLWATVTLAFLGLRLTPGDPTEAVYAEALISREELAARRTALGLDRPLREQYLNFLGSLLQGDFGESLFSSRPVIITILEQAGPTAQLALTGLVIASVFGFVLGITSASTKSSNPIIIRPSKHPERSEAQSKDAIPSQRPLETRTLRLRPAVLRLSLRMRGSPRRVLTPFRNGLTIQSGSNFLIALSQSLPVAWTGLLGLWIVTWVFKFDTLKLSSLLLPAFVVGFATAGPLAVVMRASVIAIRQEPYILAARARGLKPGWPMWKQILPVALVPVINLLALQAAFLFGGTVVTETVFARPGLGRLLVDSLLRKDFPVVQALVLGIAGLYLLFNLAADLTTAALDPRLRVNRRAR
jgi:ABC-type dipeptide/oligopeptide/nickel transport system permease component